MQKTDETFFAYLSYFSNFFLEAQKVTLIFSRYHMPLEFDRYKCDAETTEG